MEEETDSHRDLEFAKMRAKIVKNKRVKELNL